MVIGCCVAVVAWGAITLLVAPAFAGEVSINDRIFDRTRQLASIFRIPTEELPVVKTRSWSETVALAMPTLSEAQQQELDSLLEQYTEAMSHGFFDEADETAARLQARFPGRYGCYGSFDVEGHGDICRAEEPVYAFWPAFYRRLYQAIAQQLDAEYRHFTWPPRVARIERREGENLYFMQVDAVAPTRTIFLLIEKNTRHFSRSVMVPGLERGMDPPQLWARRDLDGDGREEWLVSTVEKPFSVAGNGGEFLILGGKDLSFRASEGLSPRLAFLEDVTGDGLSDAIVEFPSCGAHTCGSSYAVVTAHGGTLRRVSGRPAISNKREVHLSNNRPPELVLSGGGIGSAGAGVHRERIETWGWDGNGFVLKDTAWDKTNWRHHTVYDGDIGFAKGDDTESAAAYERAVNDTTLDDVPGDARSSCRQYAAFRLVLLNLKSGREEAGRTWRDWLAATYPHAALARATDVLYREWRATGNLAAACAVVTGMLEKEDKPVGELENMGYGNPSIKAADVCPIH